MGPRQQRQIRDRHRLHADGHDQLPERRLAHRGRAADRRPGAHEYHDDHSVAYSNRASPTTRKRSRTLRAWSTTTSSASQPDRRSPTARAPATARSAAERSVCLAPSPKTRRARSASTAPATPARSRSTCRAPSKLTIEFWLKWNDYANNDALAMEFTPNFNSNAGGFLVDPNAGQFGGTFGVGHRRRIRPQQRFLPASLARARGTTTPS